MNIQTQVNIKLSFEMDEAYARTILVDPREFQDQLREALAQAHRNGHTVSISGGGTDGKELRVARKPRQKAKRSGRNPFARAKPCVECGLKFHRKTSQCTRNPHRAVSAEEPSAA